jgi:hypothetical protein
MAGGPGMQIRIAVVAEIPIAIEVDIAVRRIIVFNGLGGRSLVIFIFLGLIN